MKVLGIGTDITECLRIAQMIERHGELFVGRVYTPLEIEYCRSRRMATQHFAGRWAAKEAVLKALGTGWRKGISWRDIEVRNGPGGRPQAFLSGRRDRVHPREHLPLPLPRHGLRRGPRRGAEHVRGRPALAVVGRPRARAGRDPGDVDERGEGRHLDWGQVRHRPRCTPG